MTQAYNKLKKKVSSLGTNEDSTNTDFYMNEFKDALSDDLNTSLALTTLFNVLKSDLTNEQKRYLVRRFDEVLSLDLLNDNNNETDSELVSYIESKIEERNKAKKDRNFELADSIRNELLEKGITLIDTREGTKYEVN
jgi:cysteinyl-tRNA synthetase